MLDPTSTSCLDLLSHLWDNENAFTVAAAGGTPKCSRPEFFGAVADVTRACAELDILNESQERARRPAHALFGPSQSGKSSSLAVFLDAKAATDGSGSALHLRGGDPWRYNIDEKREVTRYFNPFNEGKDGTGVVVRFTSRPPLFDDAKHPAEIRLCRLEDYQLALAIGYMNRTRSETNPRLPWTTQKLAEDLMASNFHQTQNLTVLQKKEGARRIILLCKLLQFLSQMENPRFRSLGSAIHDLEKTWLATESLHDEVNLKSWSAKVLWDGAPEINNMFNKAEEFLGRFGNIRGKSISCSLPVASVLANTSAADLHVASVECLRDGTSLIRGGFFLDFYKRLSDHSTDEQNRIVFEAAEHGTQQPQRSFFDSNEDFRIFHSLIWEIVVPLNVDNIKNGDFKSFIEKYDLLDFPGVPKDETFCAPLVLNGAPSPEDIKRLYTDVLKQGRTLSIFVRCAEFSEISGISIVLSLKQRENLYAPFIKTGLDTLFSSNSKSPPFNILLTAATHLSFSDPLWNQAGNSLGDMQLHVEALFAPLLGTGFAKSFQEHAPRIFLASSDFAPFQIGTRTETPFTPGHPTEPGNFTKVKGTMKEALEQFSSKNELTLDSESFEAMCSPAEVNTLSLWGMDYFFKKITAQMRTAPSHGIYAERRAACVKELKSNLETFLPFSLGGEQSHDDEVKIGHIIKRLTQNGGRYADELRAIFEVRYTDPFPTVRPNHLLQDYVKAWATDAKAIVGSQKVRNEWKGEFTSLIEISERHFGSGEYRKKFEKWLRDTALTEARGAERSHRRRFVARWLENQLPPRAATRERAHRDILLAERILLYSPETLGDDTQEIQDFKVSLERLLVNQCGVENPRRNDPLFKSTRNKLEAITA